MDLTKQIHLHNNATICPKDFPPLEAPWLYAMALITFIGFIITITSNGIIFYLFWSTPSLRNNPSNIIAFNLSLSDLILSTQWPSVIYCCLTQSIGILKYEFVCQTFGFISTVTGFASILTVLAMSVERAVVIRSSLLAKSRITIRVACATTLFIWTGALIANLPPMLGIVAKYRIDPSNTGCFLDYLTLDKHEQRHSTNGYIFALTLCFFILPAIIIFISYMVILNAFKRSSDRLQRIDCELQSSMNSSSSRKNNKHNQDDDDEDEDGDACDSRHSSTHRHRETNNDNRETIDQNDWQDDDQIEDYDELGVTNKTRRKNVINLKDDCCDSPGVASNSSSSTTTSKSPLAYLGDSLLNKFNFNITNKPSNCTSSSHPIYFNSRFARMSDGAIFGSAPAATTNMGVEPEDDQYLTAAMPVSSMMQRNNDTNSIEQRRLAFKRVLTQNLARNATERAAAIVQINTLARDSNKGPQLAKNHTNATSSPSKVGIISNKSPNISSGNKLQPNRSDFIGETDEPEVDETDAELDGCRQHRNQFEQQIKLTTNKTRVQPKNDLDNGDKINRSNGEMCDKSINPSQQQRSSIRKKLDSCSQKTPFALARIQSFTKFQNRKFNNQSASCNVKPSFSSTVLQLSNRSATITNGVPSSNVVVGGTSNHYQPITHNNTVTTKNMSGNPSHVLGGGQLNSSIIKTPFQVHQSCSRPDLQIRLAIMSFYLILLWLISWAPIALLSMINSLDSRCEKFSNLAIFLASTMTKVGPTFDVFIYGISHPKIKVRYRQIIKQLIYAFPLACRAIYIASVAYLRRMYETFRHRRDTSAVKS